MYEGKGRKNFFKRRLVRFTYLRDETGRLQPTTVTSSLK